MIKHYSSKSKACLLKYLATHTRVRFDKEGLNSERVEIAKTKRILLELW